MIWFLVIVALLVAAGFLAYWYINASTTAAVV